MNSFVDTMKQLGPSRLAVMGAIVVGLLFFFIFISMRLSTPDMRLLYADLSAADSGAVAAKLQESNIVFNVSSDGSKIMVPDTEIGRARLLLAEAGLPNGGSMGYKIFDQQSAFGTTSFVQNINHVRALEGELSRTIGSLQGVKSARVHLVLPQRELFSREKQNATASVFLSLHSGADIEAQKIAAVQSLVASAVPGLTPSNVSVIDSSGHLFAKGGEEVGDLVSAKSEEMRRKFETGMIDKIEDQVSRIVGYGNVRATVTAEMNFDRISTNEELFDPNGQVLRSSQVTEEKNTEREAPPKDVSVENNLPGIADDLLGQGQPTADGSKTEEVTNYEISKTIRSTVRETGDIKKLSVAVLVDGTYKTDDKGTPDDKADDVKTYEPRSQEELDRIGLLVRSAVGFDESRGDKVEIVNLQFSQDDLGAGDFVDENMLFGFEKSKLLDVAEMVTIAVMIILVVLLVLQPMVNRLLTMQTPEVDEGPENDLLTARLMNPALAGPSMGELPPPEAEHEDTLINVQGVEGRVKASTVKKVEEIVQNYPNETVSVIRSWMTQEG